MKIAVSGATGRMGKLIIEAVLCSNDLELVAAVSAPGVPEIGTDAGAAIGKTTGILISDDVQDLAKADVLIDFTRPQATLAYLPFCVAPISVVIADLVPVTPSEETQYTNPDASFAIIRIRS